MTRQPVAAYGAILFVAVACALSSASRAQTPAPSPQPSDTGMTIMVARGIVVPVLVTKEVRVGAFGSSQEEHKVKFAVDQDIIAVVGEGDVLKASTDRVQKHICAEPTTATPKPLPKNVILPDAELTPSP